MASLDERVAEVGGFTIFRKSDSAEYEIVGPSAANSPTAYTMIRVTPERLEEFVREIRKHSRRKVR